MQGLHLTADLFDCRDPRRLMADVTAMRGICEALTREAGLTIVGGQFHAFPPGSGQDGGLTGVLLLAESHLAVHTWPEQRAVTLDVYVCNFRHDNSAKAEGLVQALIACFGAGQIRHQRLQRGAPRPAPRPESVA